MWRTRVCVWRQIRENFRDGDSLGRGKLYYKL